MSLLISWLLNNKRWYGKDVQIARVDKGGGKSRKDSILPADIIIAKISFWCFNFFSYPNNLSLSFQACFLYRFLVVPLSKLRIFEQCNVQNWYSFSNFAGHFKLSYPQRRICIELKETLFFVFSFFKEYKSLFIESNHGCASGFLCIILKDVNKKLYSHKSHSFILFFEFSFILYFEYSFLYFIL